MRLSIAEMNAILEANVGLLDEDPRAVALEFDISDDGDVLALVLVHEQPSDQKLAGHLSARTLPGLAALPLRVEQGDMPSDEVATVDVAPLHKAALASANVGLGGTKVCEGGGCGTLCLSGANISLNHAGRICGTPNPFLLSNSHVFHRAGGVVETDRKPNGIPIGVVACVFDLEAETTFDAGVAEANGNVPRENAFKVLNPDGAPLEISGLKTALPGMVVAKMGMVSGWTEGKVGSPTITRVQHHAALYPSWRGTYLSRAGDSGSPILFKDETGLWHLVGIHFSSGPRFQSWNNVDIAVSR